MDTKIRVRNIDGELHILTSSNAIIPTGCSTNDELLDQLAIRCNYAIEFELVEI